ncbi:thioredoxin-domain-containing protein [Pseudovirgaria hyperparasitica]|uniref:protein disulfide-isomerase n=1 Tax=Pseudovirgaria hyperparasitica TaxID=470096 RepID=A0A6A6VTX0_9PEZI|nr:thioredoxin-domain-containing protein [Pseudovirgaria hyperparasitica]KAF2754138.1 thioredoxin-domain-containing protein [Pseudovirgaria hyperparasitica]
MVNTAIVTALAAGALLSTPVSGAIYLKSSPVLQLENAKAYDRLIAQSNYTSIVEFYAPWCGHCQNLKPAYEKAAKNLAGLAKVAAMNCDEEANKPFCGQMGVQGFPTLKIVRPGKKAGRPTVEDYQGPRSAKGIVDAVVDKIPNHVQRITDKNLDGFLEGDHPKAILFSDKGPISALLRSLAIDYLGTVSFAQIRNSQEKAVKQFNVENFPTLVLLPGDGKEPAVYDGAMKKEGMAKFLAQVAEPNPDPAPKPSKKDKKPQDKKEKPKESASSITLEDEAIPTEATDPETLEDVNKQKPVKVDSGPPMLEMLEHAPALEEKCMLHNSGSCLLALLPQKPLDNPDAVLDEQSRTALASLGEVQHKHTGRIFPFYAVPAINTAGIRLRGGVGLDKDEKRIEIVVINAKRNWYRHFPGDDFGTIAIEEWIDQIRMGEGKKERLPTGLIPDAPEEMTSPEEPVVEETIVEEETVIDVGNEGTHDEL